MIKVKWATIVNHTIIDNTFNAFPFVDGIGQSHNDWLSDQGGKLSVGDDDGWPMVEFQNDEDYIAFKLKFMK